MSFLESYNKAFKEHSGFIGTLFGGCAPYCVAAVVIAAMLAVVVAAVLWLLGLLTLDDIRRLFTR